MVITGEVIAIIYKNDENNYHILSVYTGKEEITITGMFENVTVDMTYEFHVIEKEHPLYGKQYALEAYKLKLPSDVDKIEHFLASGIFDGIGPAMASRIVEAFGERALDIMRYNPDQMKSIKGIGQATLKKIIASFQTHLEAEEALFFLNGLGLSPKQSFKLYEVYGKHTIEQVKNNPYSILKGVKGIGFKSVDLLASKMGFERNSTERLEALIHYLLDKEAMNGNMYVLETALTQMLTPLVSIDNIHLKETIEALSIRGDIALDKKNSDEVRIYNRSMYDIEIGIVREIARIQHASIENIDFNGNISDLELTQEQQDVVDIGLRDPMFILTGGPGTGKTTVLKEWVYRIEAASLSYSLCAPTGRAASRMEEVIGKSASTVHRLLEYMYQEDTRFLHFHRNKENPLESDVIIVDESSMMDAPLFLKLLQAIKTGSRLILIGDINQLPAVGPGNVLGDLIHSNVVDKGTLNQIHRQAADSLILTNAHAMLKGLEISVNQKGRDFFFIQANASHEIQKILLEVVSRRLPTFYSIDPIEDITVLTPLKTGNLGAEGINLSLQEVLNPSSEPKLFGRFQIGDKVMQNKNNYNIKWRKHMTLEEGEGVFNGEIGRVETIDSKGMRVMFTDGKMVLYTKELADDLVLAYGMTIHKSQGNEFDYVVIPIYNIPEVLKSRNLIYTGITRAKKQITLIGNVKVLHSLIHSNKELIRQSGLSERLKDVYQGI